MDILAVCGLPIVSKGGRMVVVVTLIGIFW